MRQTSINILKYVIRQLARLTIWRFQPEVIAITGSVGKTSTKEAIFAILAHCGDFKKKKWRARKASENFNNELGAPLTVLGNWKKIGRPLFLFWFRVIIASLARLILMPSSWYPKILILEYGAAKPGDIKYLLNIAKPKIGVITAVGEIPVHIEFYENQEAVAREKSKLIENMFINNFAVLNFDDKAVMSAKEKTRANAITFGFNEGADIRISNFENRSDKNKPLGISFKIEHKENFVPIFLNNVFGAPQAYVIGAAAVVGLIYGLNLVEISELVSAHYKPAKGRLNLISGVKNTYIIDDSYNASPASMKMALETIKNLEAKRKIAVLGDMLELGKYAIEAHQIIGKLAKEAVDVLITVGPRGKFIAEAALAEGMPKNHVLSFDTNEEAGPEVQKIIKKGDLILIKASRAMGLEKIVDEISAAPIV
ncbi:MAG: UDP-N-acetylmuramoyl-tripeptide--D-alanyl-D-alanine ligase [Patescibacteria group bacterium]